MLLPGLPSFPPYPYRRQAPPLGGLAPLERDNLDECQDMARQGTPKGDRRVEGQKFGRVPLRAPQGTRRRQSEKSPVGFGFFSGNGGNGGNDGNG
jgi:hypothetical protein